MQVLRMEITVVHGETMLPILLRSVQLLFSRVSSTPTGRTPWIRSISASPSSRLNFTSSGGCIGAGAMRENRGCSWGDDATQFIVVGSTGFF